MEKNTKPRFFYGLCSDKPWVFGQSERALGPFYITNKYIHLRTSSDAPYYLTSTKEVLYEVRCLKSTEDMILALAGQFMQLSHEPEKFSGSTGFEPMTSVICANRINMTV